MNNTDTHLNMLKQRATLKAQIQACQDEIDQIDAYLISNLEADKQTIGDWNVSRVHTRRLNTKKLTVDYPESQFPDLYKSALDTTAVKQQFAPAALEKYQNETISLRVGEKK